MNNAKRSGAIKCNRMNQMRRALAYALSAV